MEPSQDNNLFNVNDLVVNKKKPEILYKIIEIKTPMKGVISLRDFCSKNPEHAISKRVKGKSRSWSYMWNKYVVLETNKIIPGFEANGGVRLQPVFQFKITSKPASLTKKTSIANNSHALKTGVISCFQTLQHVSVLDVLTYFSRVESLVKTVANLSPGDDPSEIKNI